MAAQQDWALNEVTRQKVRQQLDDALSRVPNFTSASAEELEKKIYVSSQNSKERYVALVKQVLAKAQATRGMMRPPIQPSPQQTQQQMQVQQPSQPSMPAPSVPGVQPNRMFSNNQLHTSGPPANSPQNVNMQSPLASGGITGYSPDNRIAHQSPNQQFYRNVMQRPPQTQPQNQQPALRMPDNHYAPPSHGNPGSTYIPSLSPATHPNNSPQVPTMSPALRTPGSVTVANSPAGGAVPSPSTNQSQSSTPQNDEQLYMEKLKQLQKYIEPLSRMINKQEKNSKDLSKMKSLRDILMDSTKRLAMNTLLKCETVLQSWLDKPPPTPPMNQQPSAHQHLCQPILDVVASNSGHEMMNHTLKRTFGQALQALDGGYYVPASVCSKRRRTVSKTEQENPEYGVRIPDVIQGEVARLGSNFKVTVDISRGGDSSVLHLICRLENPSLPSVPPIRILVPRAYPKEGPEWKVWNLDSDNDIRLETSHPSFLDRLRPNMETHINSALDHNETISSILLAWERSVKQTISSQIRVAG